MTNRDLLKEAIADAKAVKETAIANAKVALEEAFTPHLKSMLAAKLEEMDKDEEVEENVELDEMDAPSFKRKSGASLDPDPKKVGQTTVQEEEEIDEEELDLEEILNELDSSDEDEKEITEANEDEAKAEEDEAEGEEAEDEEMEEEEIDLEDMSEDDLKSFIEDVIKDMVEAGELEAGEEMESEEEESEDEIEIDNEEGEDIMENEDETLEVKETQFGGEPTLAAAKGLDNIIKGLKSLTKNGGEIAKKAYAALEDLGAAAGSAMRNEEMEEIEELKKELQEVNLLNAKLLYTNKIFKSKTLSEDKKIKILKAFDKAETVKEAKVIFETLNEGIESKVSKPTVNENVKKGMASKVTGMIAENKKPIIEVDPMVARWQKLAGLKND